MTEADDPDAFGGRWELDVRGRAQRQLSRLPEKIATAAAEFITGPLLDNPLRLDIHFVMSTTVSTRPAAVATGVSATASTTAPRPSSFSTSHTDPTPTAPDQPARLLNRRLPHATALGMATVHTADPAATFTELERLFSGRPLHLTT